MTAKANQQSAKCCVLMFFQVTHHVAFVFNTDVSEIVLHDHRPTCHTTTTTEIMRMTMTMDMITRMPEDLQIISLYI
jgi:hypothetical protein